MKAKFVFNSKIPKIFGAEAITLYPFVLFASDEAYELKHRIVHHEIVHLDQVRRLGFFKMYWTYLVDYVKLRFKGFNHWDAYSRLPLELEAYARQNDADLDLAYALEKVK